MEKEYNQVLVHHEFSLKKWIEKWYSDSDSDVSDVPHLKPSVDHSVDEGVDLLDPVHAGAHQLGASQPPLPDPGGEAHGAVEEDLICHGRQTSPRAPPIESRETEVRDEVTEDAEAEGNPPPETEEMILQLHVDTER